MGVYQNGSAPKIRETFGYETVPGDFTTFVPTDPTSVTFYLRDPDNNVTTYIFGIDAELTNPSVGVYILTHGPFLLAGDWYYRAEGNDIGPDGLCAVIEGELTILPSSVLTPVVSEPVDGPCQIWCDPQDVIECSDIELSSDTSILEEACAAASEVLWSLSGRIYSGSCGPVTRNPIAIGCGCAWPFLFPGLSPGAPQFPVGAYGWWGARFGWWAWGGGCTCGAPLSTALLAGYPVTAIDEVQIDGVVLDPDEYRLDSWRYLTRMADADGNSQRWPDCPRFDLPEGDIGTWTVTYRHGKTPPVIGQKAAAQLAGEIYKSCLNQECALPPGTVQRTRMGVTVQKAPFISWGQINGRWATGFTLVDMFLSKANPVGIKRRPIAWSAGQPRYSRHLGTSA